MNAAGEERSDKASPYAYYALAIMTLSALLNYADRHIISILAESIKRDLGLADHQLGFLYGTAFAAFFAMVGIPIGRISDAVSRTSLMSLGMALWSLMTALSGFAANFAQLAAARVFVGLGEATSNPCSHSLIAQYFPSRRRALAMAVYIAGIMLGSSVALWIGGLILQSWPTSCQAWGADACGISGWRVGFLVAGVPGLLVALLIFLLKEPARPALQRQPLGKLVYREFSASLPPFSFFTIWREGGAAGMVAHLKLIAIIIAAAGAIGIVTSDWPQWIAVGLGGYSIASWVQILRYRDPPTFALTLGCPVYVRALVGAALTTCMNGILMFWAAPHAMRNLGMTASAAGVGLGAVTMIGGLIGVIAGGAMVDRWKLRDRGAPMWMALISVTVQIPVAIVAFTTSEPSVFLSAFFMVGMMQSLYSGGTGAMVQDLMLPRMRGTGSACFSMLILITMLGMGPYWSGKISSLSGSLSLGVLSGVVLAPIAAIFLYTAGKRLRHESEATRRQRAAEAGEGQFQLVPAGADR